MTVKILAADSKSVEIETKGIVKNNLPADYTAVFADSLLDIRVSGDDAGLLKLTAEDISASVDLKDVEPGEVTVPVEVVLPEGFSLTEPVTAQMTISKVTVKETDASTQGN